MVVLVGLEVLRQICDPAAQEGDLDFWGTGVSLVKAVVGDHGALHGIRTIFGRGGGFCCLCQNYVLLRLFEDLSVTGLAGANQGVRRVKMCRGLLIQVS